MILIADLDAATASDADVLAAYRAAGVDEASAHAMLSVLRAAPDPRYPID